jgi:hypothetical protein
MTDEELAERLAKIQTLHRVIHEILRDMAPANLAFLSAMHDEYFPERRDGGLRYELGDILNHLGDFAMRGWPIARYAECMRVPLDYLQTLWQATDMQARCIAAGLLPPE